MKINVKGTIVSSDVGWIYDLFGIENTNPARIARELKEANGEAVDVEINSGGGSVFAGSEIYAALRSYPGELNIHVVGLAASAASVIACARHSDIVPTAQFMVHNVSTNAEGDVHDMEHAADLLRQANRSIAAAYVEKTGMSEQDALALMDAETWLTATDAVEWGLVDEIAKPAEDNSGLQLVADIGDNMLPPSVIAKYQAEKQALMAYFGGKETK